MIHVSCLQALLIRALLGAMLLVHYSQSWHRSVWPRLSRQQQSIVVEVGPCLYGAAVPLVTATFPQFLLLALGGYAYGRVVGGIYGHFNGFTAATIQKHMAVGFGLSLLIAAIRAYSKREEEESVS